MTTAVGPEDPRRNPMEALEEAWDMLGQSVWNHRPEAVRALSITDQRAWFRGRLTEIAQEIKGEVEP